MVKHPWNWQSFFVLHPGFFTFRLFGFGVLMYHVEHDAACVFDRKVWSVPILPGVRFAFVAPWI